MTFFAFFAFFADANALDVTAQPRLHARAETSLDPADVFARAGIDLDDFFLADE